MKIETILAGVKVGSAHPVRLMGVINVSPESFYKDSVATKERAIAREAEKMEREGADFIDVGAMSTAPYLKTEISEEEEAHRLQRAVRLVRRACSCPISVDTSRSIPAEAGLEAGASIINDVTGLNRDPRLAALAVHAQGLILMAHPSGHRPAQLKSPLPATLRLLKKCLIRAEQAGISRKKIVVDPGLGFFRTARFPWWKWDLMLLQNLRKLESLGPPLMIGVSRKSFIGHLLGNKPAPDRLAGSIASTAIAVWNGASIIRTHDVAATRDAVLISKSIRDI